jgi:NAD(P)-dependent dehydrogenase (short-subunit alcohol dehydrogenase family)
MKVQESFQLRGKVAIVTGGAGLLGPQFGEALAEAGARVVLADLNGKKGPGIAREISKHARNDVVFERVDVADPQSVGALVRATKKRFKQIDILVNAAMGLGPNFYAPVESYRWEDWNRVMAVNVGGIFLCSQAVAGEMKKKRSGVIINIGSIYGVTAADQRIYGDSGINSPAVYAASKGAVIQLTRYLAAYWAKYGIRVNAISPGGVYNGQSKPFVKRYSERTPLGRMLHKEELKGALVYLASPASSYVTGHNLLVDGGWTAW